MYMWIAKLNIESIPAWSIPVSILTVHSVKKRKGAKVLSNPPSLDESDVHRIAPNHWSMITPSF